MCSVSVSSMAEGGLLPWRRQKPDGMVYETYDNLFKPLPPPPPGKVWRKMRLQPGDRDEAQGVATRWELIDRPSSLRDGPSEEQDTQAHETAEQGDPDFIEHVVLKTDTMAGLRLRYKVTAAELRRYNDFFGEQFKCCEVLRVPRKGQQGHSRRQAPSREVLRQRFRIATKCSDEQMVTYYLEFNEWDVARAVAEHQEDKEWEARHTAAKTNQKGHNNRPQPPTPPLACYTPPPVILGPPPSYRSLFGSRLMGRPPSPSPTTHELNNVVSSSSPFARLPLLPLVPSPFRTFKSPEAEQETTQPLLARVVEEYDMRPHTLV